jgi:NADH-quinone oxidoreductase subunit M
MDLQDLNFRELVTLVPLVVLAFWIGLYPRPMFRILDQPVQKLVQQVNGTYYAAAAVAESAAPAPAATARLR